MTPHPTAEVAAVKSHPECAGELACGVLDSALESVAKTLKLAATQWDSDAEHVHQLRVSSRRALAAFRLFADLIPASHAKWFRKKLKTILDSAGKARDLDVLIQNQLPKCGPAADSLGKVWKEQRDACQESIVRVQKKLQKQSCLRSRSRSLLTDLKTSIRERDSISQQQCGDWAKSRIPDLCRQFFAAIPGRAEAGSLHQLRILTKRFRYTLSILQRALPNREISEAHAALEQLQKQLGTLQDHVIARKQFQKSLKQLKRIRDQKLVRRLIEKEDRKVAQRVDRFRLESDSETCHQLRFCIDAVMSLQRAAEAGFR